MSEKRAYKKIGKETELAGLPLDSYFCFKGMEEEFRKLKLLRANDCGCAISGFHRTKEFIDKDGKKKDSY